MRNVNVRRRRNRPANSDLIASADLIARASVCASFYLKPNKSMGFSDRFEQTEPSRADVDALPGPTVLEFGAPWCGYCQSAAPLIASAFATYPHVRHLKVEDGKGQPLGRSFRVKLWPTLIFLAHGEERERLVRPTDQVAIERALAYIATDELDSTAIRASE